MTIIATGIDLAKNVFAVHGVNGGGVVQLRQPKVARGKLGALIAGLPPGIIGMEACSGAHHWARQFQAHGHTVRLMAPKLVTPYRMSGKRGKNDAADAAAICEAMQRPNMRFVPIKTEQQQAQLMVHRARQGFVTERTACINRIRGLLTELGVVLPLKAEVVRRQAREHLEDLPGYANLVIGDLLSEVAHLDERISQYDRHVHAMAKQSTAAQQLMQLMGGHGHGAGGDGGQCHRVQLRSAVRGLDRPGAGAIQLGRQGAPGAHHQGRRPVPAQPVGDGRACRAQRGQEQDRQHQPVGAGRGTTARLLEGGGGHGGEERAPGLGGADQG